MFPQTPFWGYSSISIAIYSLVMSSGSAGPYLVRNPCLAQDKLYNKGLGPASLMAGREEAAIFSLPKKAPVILPSCGYSHCRLLIRFKTTCARTLQTVFSIICLFLKVLPPIYAHEPNQAKVDLTYTFFFPYNYGSHLLWKEAWGVELHSWQMFYTVLKSYKL